MGEEQKVKVRDFDLRLTLQSGQFFRYTEHHGSFLVLTCGKSIMLWQQGDELCFSGADELFIRKLFSLNKEHGRSINRLMCDSAIKELVQRYKTIRVMRIDLYESILGFICSSQSNIPKIRMNLHLIAVLNGIIVDDHSHLPACGKPLQIEDLVKAKTGFRAKYLAKASEMITQDLLNEILSSEYRKSHELLCGMPGIGPKIADCICLFALGHGEAFPVDVHVLRAMRILFPRSRLVDEKKARIFAQRRWGKDAGLAQQIIFQWARDNAQALRTRQEQHEVC